MVNHNVVNDFLKFCLYLALDLHFPPKTLKNGFQFSKFFIFLKAFTFIKKNGDVGVDSGDESDIDVEMGDKERTRIRSIEQ